MKKLLILPAILVVVLVGAILAFNAGAFNATIAEKLSAASGAKIQFDSIAILTFPLRLQLGRTEIEHNLAQVEWERLEIEVANPLPPMDLRVLLRRPKVRMRETSAQAPPSASTPASPAPSFSARGVPAVRLTLRVEGGEIEAPQVYVSSLDLSFAQQLLMRAPAALQLTAFVKTSMIPAKLPVTLETDSLILSEESLKTAGLKATVAGLSADVQGTSLLKEGRHRWLLEVKAPDLSALPKPPDVVPAKNWKGAIEIAAELNKPSAEQPWQAEGKVKATGVTADLLVHQAGATAEGAFALDLNSKFLYLNNVPSLPELNGQLDLTGAKVLYADLFSKAPNVPLRLKIDASGDATKLSIRDFTLQVAQLRARLSGTASAQSPWESQLKIEIPQVALLGLEKLLPPLRQAPVRGEATLQASIHGPLAAPMQASITVESLRLKDFAAEVEYTKPGLVAARGPIVADILGSGLMERGQLKSAKAQGSVNLKSAALVLGPLRKEAGQELSAVFTLGNKGETLTIDKLEMRSFFGRFAANGAVVNPLKPKLNVNLVMAPLKMSELRVAMPEFRDKIPSGEMRAAVRMSGELANEKPWNEWPLQISGDVSVSLPEYKMVEANASKPAPPQAAAPLPTPSAEPFLPPGYLTNQLNLKVSADIGQLVKDKLLLRQVSAKGTVSGGRFRGQAAVGQIFGGSVKATALDVPLLTKSPTLQGQVNWDGVIIEEALGFAKPEYKTMASGKTAGRADFSTLMPGEKNFFAALKARGDLGAAPLTLNSVKIGEMINDMLKKIPLLRISPVKVDPLRGSMKTQFDMANETMQIAAFEAKDLDGSELQMKGKVLLSSMQVDLAGTFFWVQDQVKGCLAEGNSDAKGRLVVPLALKGDAMKPGFSILSDVAGRLAGRALECEKSKLVDKVKKQGGEAVKKELGKALKGLFGN
ncbi:MAG: hypothetical protein KF799_13710 [Bdellovibrionales bacterium]|nr:hypothetical protein [Bdellovibrionales bacterium]